MLIRRMLMQGTELFGFAIGALVLFYLGFSAYLVLNEQNLIYNPQKALAASPTQHGLSYSDHQFETADGIQLHGWLVPAPQSKALVLFFHGNTGNISHRIETLEILHRLNYSVFIFDYRGYGRSTGAPSEEGTYEDARAAWRYVTEPLGFAASDVVIFGRSLGGAIASKLATEVKARALVIESSFTSMPALAQQLYPWLPVKFLSRIRYDTLGRISEVKSPLLVIHSRDDELIAHAHGQALYEAFTGEKSLLTIRGRHNDGFVFSGALYARGLEDFLARYES